MKKLSYMLILSGLVSMSAFAEDSALSGNIGVTTDYLFRGISQSQHKPAISGGFDYAHPSGVYVGTWMSNQGWVATGPAKTNSSMEIDLYGGYRGEASGIGYDVGLITYYYPGDRAGALAGAPTPDTTEVYVGASWSFLSMKYSHTVSDYFVGWGSTTPGASFKTNGSNYLELNASYDLGDGWGVIGHVGKQEVKNFAPASYTDWKIGATKDIGYGTVTAAYSDTDGDPVNAYTFAGKDVSKGVFTLSFSKSF